LIDPSFVVVVRKKVCTSTNTGYLRVAFESAIFYDTMGVFVPAVSP
jgi:hypothetical protein